MTLITLPPNDINRFLPDIELLKDEVNKHNFITIEKTLNALSDSKLSDNITDNQKNRCFTFLCLCYDGLVQEKLDRRLILKVQSSFVRYDALPTNELPKKITCIGKDNKQIEIKTKHLMAHTLEFTKGIFSGKAEAAISLPKVPLPILKSFKEYISKELLQETLSVEDLVALYRLARDFVVEDLCRACFDRICQAVSHPEQALKHYETLAAFFIEKDRTISEEERDDLACTFIKTVLTQNDIKQHIKLEGNRIALSAKDIYLINQNNAFAKLLEYYVTGLFFHSEEDLEHIGELHLLSATIKWLDIRVQTSSETFKKIVSLLPNVEKSAICIEMENHVVIFDTIAKIDNLRYLHLYLPAAQVVKEEEDMADGLCKKFLGLFITSPSISATYQMKTCTFLMTKNLFDLLAKKITTFTVDHSCDIDFSHTYDGVYSYPMHTLRDRFQNCIILHSHNEYSYEDNPMAAITPRITKFTL